MPAAVDRRLGILQDHLLALGAAVAAGGSSGPWSDGSGPVAFLEDWIRELEQTLPPLRRFIRPGGPLAAAHLHLARTVCRRAERRLVALQRQAGGLPPRGLVFLNRLGDLLFLLARQLAQASGQGEETWGGRQSGGNPKDAGA
jgi:cob(I)alamin adenosyltransferase